MFLPFPSLNMGDEFYIGWEAKAAPGIGKIVRKAVFVVLALALLVSADGKPVNKQVLDMVAEPLEITGEVERQGELLILRADPVTYRKL